MIVAEDIVVKDDRINFRYKLDIDDWKKVSYDRKTEKIYDENDNEISDEEYYYVYKIISKINESGKTESKITVSWY